MLSFQEVIAEDRYLAEPPPDDDDAGIFDGWDLDFFPEDELRPELRFFIGRHPDVTFTCRGGRAVQAHRAVLTEVKYFESLFNGPFKEREAQTLEVDEDPLIVFEVMRWIYCGDAFVDKDTVMEVLRLAEFYGVDGLSQHCGRLLVAFGLVKLESHSSLSKPAELSAEDPGASSGSTNSAAPALQTVGQADPIEHSPEPEAFTPSAPGPTEALPTSHVVDAADITVSLHPGAAASPMSASDGSGPMVPPAIPSKERPAKSKDD